MGVPARVIVRGMFGKPTLQWLKNNGTESNGRATWVKEWNRYNEWAAKLSPGNQTDDDYGSVSFTVNNMKLAELDHIAYVYRMGATEVVAPNISIHVFDPVDIENRADITYSHSAAALGVTSGWQKFRLLPDSTAAMFYYGNNIPSSTGLTGDNGTSLYTLAAYQADAVFKNYVIGKITIEYGYYSTGYLSPAHICKVVVNNEDLLLEPSAEEILSLGFDDLSNAARTIPTWTLGQPELRHDNEGWGQWEHKALQAKFKDSYDTNRHFRFGNWAVHLNGGPQASEESWASVAVPINDMRVQDITSIAYDWYAQYNGSSHILDIGPNLVFSAYDPTNHAARVDFNTYAVDNNIFMADGLANRPVEAGWYKYEMTSTDSTERVYWYGNNTGTQTTAPAQGADGYWSQYITDAVFADWVVYRIQVMQGYWGSTRSAGDVWIANLRINGEAVRWEPSEAEKLAIQNREGEMYGDAVLFSGANGKALWENGWHYGASSRAASGWVARLIGGKQSSWDDFAQVKIPVDNMHVPDFKTAKWMYWMENTEAMGVNLVIHVHDPFNFDQEAEITQAADTALLDKAAGWNSHELNPSTDQFYYYGTDATSELTEGAGNQYGWDDFVADEQFNTWVIDSISLAYGWHSGDMVFDGALILELEINGQNIPLKPSLEQTWLSDHYIKNDIPISSGIYTPRRIHVKPVFANYLIGSNGHDQEGIGHLVRGGYGLTAGNGGNIDLDEGYVAHLESTSAGTDVCSFAIPLNIPVNKIETLTYLEKTQDDTDKQPIMSFRLDAARRGAWAHDQGTSTTSMYLADYRPAGSGSSNDWAIVSPLADATWQLKNWHTRIATPDGGINSSTNSTFAAYKATDIGGYYIKQFVIAYTGDTAGDWAKIGSLVINGVEYVFDLNPNDKIRHFYAEHANDVIAKTLFPQTPFRLLSIDIHLSAALADTEVVTITKDSGIGTDGYHDTVIFSEDLFINTRLSYHGVFGKGYEFSAVDHLDLALSANSLNRNIGIDVTWEVL